MPYSTEKCVHCNKPRIHKVAMGTVFTEQGKQLLADIFDSTECANIHSFDAIPFFESLKAQELFIQKHPQKWKQIQRSKKRVLIIKREA